MTIIEQIEREYTGAGPGLNRLGLLIISAPFYVLGWLTGVIVSSVYWVVGAFVAGYKAGRGVTD